MYRQLRSVALALTQCDRWEFGRLPCLATMVAGLLRLAFCLAVAVAVGISSSVSTAAALPPPPTVPLDAPAPAGYRLAPADAVALAARAGKVAAERRKAGDLRATAGFWGRIWTVRFSRGDEVRAEVVLDDRNGRILAQWQGFEVNWALARGRKSAFVPPSAEPIALLALALLMVFPFVDFRRLRRILHLDLLVLASLIISMSFYTEGEIRWSTLLVYPVLAYFAVRMLVHGHAPRRPAGALFPHIHLRLLGVALVVLLAVRLAVQLDVGRVVDIGYASVAGADLLAHGHSVYEGGLPAQNGDTYGPSTYLAYVPIELLLPWQGSRSDVPAAEAAAATFDLLTIVVLLFVGRRMRPGREGWAFGLALAWAWAACPFTMYALTLSTNDALVSLSVITAFAVLSHPFLRGAVAAIAAGTKFAPAAIAPLIVRGLRGPTAPAAIRPPVMAFAGFSVVGALLLFPQLPEGGLWGFWYQTVGWQVGRDSPFSLWGLEPSVAFLQWVPLASAAVLAIGTALRPPAGLGQLAARAAAVLIAVEIGLSHWFYTYVLWFLPLLLIALFERTQRAVEPRSGSTRAATIGAAAGL